MRTSGLFLLLTLPLFFSCSGKKTAAPIPADAILVARINTAEVIEEIALEKWKDFSIGDLLESAPEDTVEKKKGIENILNDPSGAGLDILSDIWIFHRNNETGIIAGLEDHQTLEEAIRENIKGEIQKSEKLSSFITDKISAVWSEEYLLILYSEEKLSSSYLYSFFSKERMLFQPVLPEEHSEKEMVIWTSNTHLKSFLPQDYHSIIHPDSFALTTIDFEKGQFIIKNQNLLNATSGVLQPIKVSSHALRDKNLLSLALALNFKAIPFENPHFSQSFLDHCFEGNIFLKIDSIGSFEKIISTQVIDEEFNCIELKDTLRELYPAFDIQALSLNKDSCNLFLSRMEKLGFLLKEGTNYKFTLTSYPIYFWMQENSLCISSNSVQEKESNFSDSPIDPLLFMTFNRDKHRSDRAYNYLPEALESTTIIASTEFNNSLSTVCTVKTSKEEYSLLTLINYLKANMHNILPDKIKEIS